MGNSDYKYDIFISYSRIDKEVADKICLALQKQGISFFIDRKGIGGGKEFPEILASAILESQIVLFLASKNSYTSKFTNKEITFAFNEKPSGTLLPYVIDNSKLPSSLRFTFADINIRTLEEHPIDTILMEDLCQLLGREYRSDEMIRQEKENAEKSYRDKLESEYQQKLKEKEEEYRRKVIEALKGSSNDQSYKTEHTEPQFSNNKPLSDNRKKTLNRAKKEKKNDSFNTFCSVIAIISPFIMLVCGIAYGIETNSFWNGLEIFLVPSWVLFFLFMGKACSETTKEMVAWIGVSLLGVVVSAGIHSYSYTCSIFWSVVIGLAIFILGAYLFFKYI
jgi:hypothetical protein